jgi:hypothetical protein
VYNGLYDITRQVEAIEAESGIQTGLVNVYAQGTSAGLLIQFIMMTPFQTILTIYCVDIRFIISNLQRILEL